MINPEPVTVAFLAVEFPEARVVTETPDDLQQQLPVIKVQGLGGQRKLNLGRPTLDVECYAATRDAARDLAGDVSDALVYRMRGPIGGAIVTDVRGAVPDFRPYGNVNVRRFGGIYQIWLHDQ